MCGIAGLINKKGAPSSETIEALKNSIRHRGPDESSHYIYKNVALINTRLSILDPADGQQPLVSDDEKVVVVQNGEIYNFVEIREELKRNAVYFKTNCDTEVILKSYEYYGETCVEKFNGMFAICILDKTKNKIFLYRDRLGVKPLFIYQDGQHLAFGSEIKSFLSIPDFKKELNAQSIFNYLCFNYVPLPETIYKNVTHVRPGGALTIDLSDFTVKENTYWQLANIQERNDINEEALIDEIHELLLDSTRLRLRSDVPISAFLSGGLDSSLVCQYMVLAGLKEFSTYTIGFHEKEFDESAYAQYINSKLKLNPNIYFLKDNIVDDWVTTTYYCDQPHGDISFLPTYFLSGKCAESYKVALTGDGGDELFGGYDKYKLLEDRDFSSQKYFEHISLLKNQESFNKIFHARFLKQVDVRQPYKIFSDTIQTMSNKDHVNQALFFDTVQLLPGNNLVKPDRMGMAKSLEARSPFMDYRLHELMMTIPGAYKLKNGETKYILKKLATRYFDVDHIYRKKQMFTVPVGEWFKSNLKEFLVKTLESERLREMNLFNSAEIKQMAEEHIGGKMNYTRELRAMANIELWAQSYM